MSKKLSIILLYYNEPENLTKPMLDCLEGQLGINWDDIEIIFSSSSADVKDIDLTNYPKISSVAKRVKQDSFAPGPGASQQIAMDIVEGEYLWRLDIDDVLVDRFSVFYVLRNLEVHHDPNILILSCIGPDAVHHAPTELASGVPVPMASFLWVIKTSIIKENNLRFFPYTMVWEDVNYATLLWSFLEWNNGVVPSTEEFIYEHFDRKDSTFYTQYRYKPLKVIQEVYYQFVYNIKSYLARSVPIETQVYYTFLMAYSHFYPQITDELQRIEAENLMRSVIQTFPDKMLPLLKGEDLIENLFNRCIVIKAENQAQLSDVLTTLSSIETQEESTELSLSTLQIICVCENNRAIRTYDYVHNFPLIGRNVICVSEMENSKLFSTYIVPSGMALLIRAGFEAPNSTFIGNWFKENR